MSNLPEQPTLKESEIDSLYEYSKNLLSNKEQLNLSDKQCASIKEIMNRCVEAAVKWYAHK